jgi:hypothetical protein
MGASTDIRHVWRARQEMGGTDHPGWRLNNLSTTQRDALTGGGAAKAGDIIWNTTTSAIEFYDGSTWSGVPVAVSEAELTVLDGASSTPTASKAVIATSSGWQAVRRPVIEDGASVVLGAADSGALCVFDKVDGALFTLPTPAIGLWYEFIVVASVTSSSMKVITNAGTVFIIGSVDMVDTDTTFTHTNQDANGTTHVAVTMAAASTNSTGGIKGTRFVLTCRTATTWTIHGQINHAGTVATPFTTS